GPVEGIKQDKAQVTKAPKLKKEDGLIDWSRDAVQVCNQIRAMQPWPTAYTFVHRDGKPPVRIIVSRATPSGPFTSRPTTTGLVFEGEQQTLHVTAGPNTFVEIHELQPAGKKRMSAREFLRGHVLQSGDHFGAETP